MELMRILQTAMQLSGSDIFILPGSRISMKINGAVVPILDDKVRPEDAFDPVNQVYATSERNLERPSAAIRGRPHIPERRAALCGTDE